MRYGPGLVIVHGDATGIDRSFAEACGDLGVEQEAHPARWEEPGPSAGGDPVRQAESTSGRTPLLARSRNQAMVDARAELCIAFHRALGASKGTEGLRKARTCGRDTDLPDRLGGGQAESAEGGGRKVGESPCTPCPLYRLQESSEVRLKPVVGGHFAGDEPVLGFAPSGFGGIVQPIERV